MFASHCRLFILLGKILSLVLVSPSDVARLLLLGTGYYKSSYPCLPLPVCKRVDSFPGKS